MKSIFNFVALDIETTGFDFDKNEIIEIGAVKYHDGKFIEEFSTFIKPLKPVPQFIKQLTNITDEQLASGTSLKDALKKITDFVKDEIIICHNVGFDIGFINKKLKNNDLPKVSNRLFDTVELSRIYLSFILNHKLGTVADYFKIDLSHAHRAIFDAKATAEVFIKLLDFIDENISLQLNFRLSEISLMAYSKTDLPIFLEKIVEHQKKYALLSKKKPWLDFHNRNYIEHKPEKAEEITVEETFKENGLFDKKFENYEIRNGQIEMSEAVLNNFHKNEYLLVEAGTGVGKSLAYLIPAIIHTNKNKTKVIISTNTKNLQEQLFYKDLPTVKDCVNIPFKAVLLKGRRNYLCEKKWAETSLDFNKIFSSYEAQDFLYLVVWKEFTKTGDISENSSLNANSLVWKKLSADRYFCFGRKCPYFRQCYLMDVRLKAETSNLVIINHHLLLADLRSENSALGKYDNLIIDEAHNLPHIAPIELGSSLGYADFNGLFSQLFAVRRKFQSGTLINLKTAVKKSRFEETKRNQLLSNIEDIIDLIETNKIIFAEFLDELGKVVEKRGSYGKLRITDLDDHPFITRYLSEIIKFWEQFSKCFVTIKNILSGINSKVFVDYSLHLDVIDGILQRIAEYYNLLVSFYNPNFQDFAYWISSFKPDDKKYPNGILNLAPLSINQILNDLLYKNVKSIIFTSATIALRGKYKYFANRMGLDLLEDGFVQELIVESPFDYQKQSMILVAGFLPGPKDRFFSAQSINLIQKTIEISQTGTMILFTSYKDLNKVYDELSGKFSNNITLLAQGKGMSRSAMLNEFRENKKTVLLGTNSFWEGVDVPGESLSFLILYKLPFLVPSEPIIEAYLEKLESEGKNSFMHYMMPNALLKYRQGFGRLIRNKTDKGVVLVLDSRIFTKEYGHFFKDIVPAKTIIPFSDIEIYDYLGKWFSLIG